MPRQSVQIPQSESPFVDAGGKLSVVWYLFLQQLAQDIPQVGDCIVQAAGECTADYLKCDGSAVSKTIEQNLFAVIGIAYGTGDGLTTFNLPNFASVGAPSFWKIRRR